MRQHRSPPHWRRVLSRILFLACFGIGDFSVFHGRHALASQRLAMAHTSMSTTTSSVRAGKHASEPATARAMR